MDPHNRILNFPNTVLALSPPNNIQCNPFSDKKVKLGRITGLALRHGS